MTHLAEAAAVGSSRHRTAGVVAAVSRIRHTAAHRTLVGEMGRRTLPDNHHSLAVEGLHTDCAKEEVGQLVACTGSVAEGRRVEAGPEGAPTTTGAPSA